MPATKLIKALTWVADWRPGTLDVPASPYVDKYPYYGGYDIIKDVKQFHLFNKLCSLVLLLMFPISLTRCCL